MDERIKLLEPMVSKIMAEKYERKLPPNLFAETPPKRVTDTICVYLQNGE
jgi:hypothetical protein